MATNALAASRIPAWRSVWERFSDERWMRVWLLLPAGLMALAVTLFVKLVFVHESVRRRMFPILRPLYTLTYSLDPLTRPDSRH